MKTRSRQSLRARRNPYFEFLEERTMMSATVTTYTVPDVSPVFNAYDSDGNLWVVNMSFASGHQTLDELIDGSVADSIIIDDASPIAIAAGANGHIWIADSNGGLDDVNTGNGTVTPHLFIADTFADAAKVPTHLTVTPSGNVWFTGRQQGEFTDNYVGHYNPTTDTVSYLQLDSSTNDSQAIYLSANGADGVWLGMPGIGTNHLANLAFSGSSFSASYYAVHTLNAVPDAATADAGNPISGVASDGTGGVWFSLANSTDTSVSHGADRVVHGTLSGGNLNQTAYVLDNATVANPQNIGNVVLDSTGKLWFNELNGTSSGYFDTAALAFTVVGYPANGNGASNIVVNPTGDQASFINFDEFGGGSIVQIDVPATVTFSGATGTPTGQERTTFNSFLLATFIAPPPATGSYSAVITWGDSTTSTVAATYMGSNTYAVIVSGKSFASQGTYNGTITIKDSANVVAGTLTFQSLISDTPLMVTSFNTLPLILRIVTATATFTDDPGRAASGFTATINWGDSTSSNGIIVADPTQAGRYLVIAIHQYKRRGTFTAHLTVTTNEAMALINVNTANSTVTV